MASAERPACVQKALQSYHWDQAFGWVLLQIWELWQVSLHWSERFIPRQCVLAILHDHIICGLHTSHYALYHSCSVLQCTNDTFSHWQQLYPPFWSSAMLEQCMVHPFCLEVSYYSRQYQEWFPSWLEWQRKQFAFQALFAAQPLWLWEHDLILLAYLTLPSSIFGHIIVRFDYFTTDVWSSPLVWISGKVLISRGLSL